MLNDGWPFFDQAPGGLVLADRELVVVRANIAFGALLGRTTEALIGHDASSFLRPEDREVTRERLQALLIDRWPYAVEQRFEHADGHDVWLRVHVGAVDDGSGELLFMAQVEDTTDQRRTTARLRRLAERDHLTGLLNRRRIEEELEKVLAGVRRHGRRAALVLIDLDHFKAVNDRGGHEAGDRMLSFVAATLATRVREEDAVARVGGDEFVILLRDTTLEAAEGVAAEIVALVADAGYTREHGVTLSAGVAALTTQTRTAQDALHAADLAMYAAKAAGRDRVAVHAPSSRPAGNGASEHAVALPPHEGSADPQALLGGLRAVADAPTVDHALQAVRDLLGMDLSYATHHTDTEQVILATKGDAASFDVAAGTRFPLDATYCQRILRGELPSAMPDVRALPGAAGLRLTEAARIGAYVSVPICLSDGTLYGTLCAASHKVAARVGERDLRFLAVVARMVAGELERDAALRAQLALRAQAAGAEALLSAIEARDRYTGDHSRNVVDLTIAVASELALSEHERRQAAQVALLHDIGKLALPDSILSKPGPLSHEETALMRCHPENGERIVGAIPELAHLAPDIRAEHERWDGAGYPDGLSGEEIPIASRIVFVCDAWDAMTSDRPYRRRMSRDAAVAELATGATSQFSDVCVQALFAVLARG